MTWLALDASEAVLTTCEADSRTLAILLFESMGVRPARVTSAASYAVSRGDLQALQRSQRAAE